MTLIYCRNSVKRLSAKFLYLAAVLKVVSGSLGPTGDLYIANKVVSPDGFPRTATLAGESVDSVSFPGPNILAKKNDNIRINVKNQLSDPSLLRDTSIHWHGIFQNKTNYADGGVSVSQCPITPNASFVYDFKTYSQAGTYWYHSHYATQYCDGLRAPLILYDDEDPYKSHYDVDDESTIITLSDWYHVTYLSGLPLTPDSTLINGLGRYVGGPPSPLAVVNVEHGKRYRFRVISTSCEPSFNFAIDNHKMTVIEADGQYTEPLEVDNFQLHASQRYSVIVEANQPVANYWMRSNPDAFGFPGFDNGRNLAIFRYKGAPIADPATDPTAPTNFNYPLNEYDLHALIDPVAPGAPYPGGADLSIHFITNFNVTIPAFFLNGVQFVPPNVPALLQILSGTKDAQSLLPQGSYFPLPRNKVIEVSFTGAPAATGGPHPFHLHGHTMYIVRSANSTEYNYKNPVRRDTVSIGDVTDNVTFRFVTDNPGPWFLHCHKDFHLELGLAIVFAEDLPSIPKEVVPPSQWNDLCPKYNQLKSEGIY